MMTVPGVVLSGSLLLHGIVPHQATDLEKIDRAAQQFAQREDIQALVENNKPKLEEVYPLVVRDFYSKAGRNEPIPEPRPAHVNQCARHYEDFWIKRRFIWPTRADGTPD